MDGRCVCGGWWCEREIENDVSIHIDSRKTAAQHGRIDDQPLLAIEGLEKVAARRALDGQLDGARKMPVAPPPPPPAYDHLVASARGLHLRMRVRLHVENA